MRIALALVGVLALFGFGPATRGSAETKDPAAPVQKPASETKPAVEPAAEKSVIVPGIEVEFARKTLRQHGYDKWDLALAISSRDKNIELDTWRIDDNITLILGFDKRTKKVTKLSLHIEPDHPTRVGQVVVREILEMRFEKDGVYAVKLRRQVRESKTAK